MSNKKRLVDYGGRLITETFQAPSYLRPPMMSEEPPIAVKKVRWAILDNPRRFSRIFEFENEMLVGPFLENILEYQAECRHHGRITIDGPTTVMVEVWTHSFPDLTEMDQEYIRMIDLIYIDVLGFDVGV